jgi:hypothetical protein
LGVHHSFVLSTTLDDWTEEQVQHMESRGNLVVNEELEWSVPVTMKKPSEHSERAIRDAYITAKYAQKSFRQAEGACPMYPRHLVPLR